MRKQLTFTFGIILFSLIFLMGTISLNAIMAGNESETAFDEEETTTPQSAELLAPSPLKQLIVDGGGAFLQSAADFHSFISQSELSEIHAIDFTSLSTSLDGAIDNIKKANTYYGELNAIATQTPYNYSVIRNLYAFDYCSFEEKRGLIPSIFYKVECYLMVGDVRGVYGSFYSQTLQILSDLQNLKTDVDAKTIPPVSKLWRINQKYAEFKLFGQYVAEVFFNL